MSDHKSQVYIFYGEDDFSLVKKIEHWKEEFAKKFTANGITIIDAERLDFEELMQQLERVAAPSLFASKKLVICKEGIPNKAGQEPLADFITKLAEQSSSNDFYVFYATKPLDKRLTSVKKILKSNANLSEFELPHGTNLNGWLKAYTKILGAEIDNPATEKLALYLGRDLFEEKKFGGKIVERKEVYNLWQAHSELSKLASHSQKISVADVIALVPPKISENIFDLSDTILNENKSRALELLENLFADQSSDEKTIAIKIVALLAEQIRALLLVSLLKERQLNNDEIAETLGWSSGRVFMVLKQNNNKKPGSLRFMLSDLLKIDARLKSTDSNPKLMVDVFVAKFA